MAGENKLLLVIRVYKNSNTKAIYANILNLNVGGIQHFNNYN